jgi:hypothetical protein
MRRVHQPGCPFSQPAGRTGKLRIVTACESRLWAATSPTAGSRLLMEIPRIGRAHAAQRAWPRERKA